MYSHTTSILHFNWAEIGITGAPSATVPLGQNLEISITKTELQIFHLTKTAEHINLSSE